MAVVRRAGVCHSHTTRVLPDAAARAAALHHQTLLHVETANAHYHLLCVTGKEELGVVSVY